MLIKKEIAALIFLIRSKRVMLDSDLPELYKVETKQLNRAVKRNQIRFPQDFMFQLTTQELENLRCQIGTSKMYRGGRRYPPYAFSEHGVAMLASVLQSKEAALINIQIVRAFVAMRETISTHVELALKLEQLEYRLGQHDDEIASLFEAIKQLMKPLPEKKKNRIGF
jgi:hypothetical protein